MCCLYIQELDGPLVLRGSVSMLEKQPAFPFIYVPGEMMAPPQTLNLSPVCEEHPLSALCNDQELSTRGPGTKTKAYSTQPGYGVSACNLGYAQCSKCYHLVLSNTAKISWKEAKRYPVGHRCHKTFWSQNCMTVQYEDQIDTSMRQQSLYGCWIP